jgi:release factor glutamine methyltransferase
MEGFRGTRLNPGGQAAGRTAQLIGRRWWAELDGTWILRVPGVYGPCRDSELLAGVVAENVRAGDRVLDLFTGSGVVAIEAAAAGADEVLAVDVSRRAIAAVRVNSLLNGSRVRPNLGDGFAAVTGDFDVILANPPFVPSVDEDAPVAGAARAWEAGPDGRRFLDPFLEEAPRHLRPGGRILVVHSSLCDECRTLALMNEAGLSAEIIRSETAPLGPVTAPRAAALERRGLLEPGQRTETTVVIRGTATVPAASRDQVPLQAAGRA